MGFDLALPSAVSDGQDDGVRAFGRPRPWKHPAITENVEDLWFRVDFEYDPLYEGAFSDHKVHSYFCTAESLEDAAGKAAFELTRRYGIPNVRLSQPIPATEAEADRYAEDLQRRFDSANAVQTEAKTSTERSARK